MANSAGSGATSSRGPSSGRGPSSNRGPSSGTACHRSGAVRRSEKGWTTGAILEWACPEVPAWSPVLQAWRQDVEPVRAVSAATKGEQPRRQDAVRPVSAVTPDELLCRQDAVRSAATSGEQQCRQVVESVRLVSAATSGEQPCRHDAEPAQPAP